MLALSDVRLLFENVNAPTKDDQGEDVWTACLVFPKSYKKTEAVINKYIKDLMLAQWGNKALNNPALITPLKDGDNPSREGNALFAGSWYVNVKTKRKPILVDTDGSSADGTGAIYSGCYVSVLLRGYAYDKRGNKGVGLSFSAIQKVADGERIASSFNPSALLGEILGNPTAPQAQTTAPQQVEMPF